MMILIGHASSALVVSAAFLTNYSLTVLFGLAAIRNYVFSYTDWRKKKGKHVAKWVPYFFAGVFATLTITATTLILTVFNPAINSNAPFMGARNDAYGNRVYGIPVSHWIVEIFICLTLLGLIVGNVLKGTHLMRVSFVFNRMFNIINHLYFGNVIGVIIASMAIGSNIVFYIRILVECQKKKKAPVILTADNTAVILPPPETPGESLPHSDECIEPVIINPIAEANTVRPNKETS